MPNIKKFNGTGNPTSHVRHVINTLKPMIELTTRDLEMTKQEPNEGSSEDLFVVIFVDDILIYSPSEEEHQIHLSIILELLREHRLYAKLSKCEFWLSEVKFLGHVVSKDGVSIDPGKIKSVMNWQRPKSVFEIRNFLGLVGYYRRFVLDFSCLAAPMTRLTRNGTLFVWGDACEMAFEELKRRLTTASDLIMPERGVNYSEYYDASKKGLGCVLMQLGK
ncbi:uncharacterized mitochondrial protein AtMg00860-like [Rhododendron vialii]|uniref:uncharacterized mitochondrial protein AtMg00860-like n=1 Tax=Rhododendron vialii TaxID=182163 RepID=UPI00265EDF66|nr:uncharacterized mitochondrial protein AtMg00860-like [Rhododendron vialii]